MTAKIRLPVLTVPGQGKQIDFPGKKHNKHVTGEPNILVGIDRYSKWPVVWIRISTEAEDFNKFLESFIKFYGIPEKIK